MFNNIVVGPICAIFDPDIRENTINSLWADWFILMFEVTNGELFEEIKQDFSKHPNAPGAVTSVILSVGYKSVYYE